MSRPCQQRRASAAANRKSKSSKPAGPPPIRHKARQKAIHNARHPPGGGRGGVRGRGRGGGRGGRGGRGGGRGGHFAQKNGRNDSGQDFIPLTSGGNNFEALYRSRRDDDFDLEADDDSSDSDQLLDEDMHDTEDIAINVQAPPPTIRRGRQPRAQIMFTEAAAVAVYRQIYLRNFPLITTTTRVRYKLHQEDASADSSAYISFAPPSVSRRSSASSATSDGSLDATSDDSMDEPTTLEHNPARDYVWKFGVHVGKRFMDVPDNYAKTIGGQLYRYMDKYVGLLEAFEYYRPGQARLKPPQAHRPQTQPQQTQTQPSQPQPQPSQSQAPSASDTWRFKKGLHEGKRLHDVPENYIRTLENNPLVRNAWPGFIEAVHDFNAKTGRQGRA